jgi:trimeric autotransporter adhesin
MRYISVALLTLLTTVLMSGCGGGGGGGGSSSPPPFSVSSVTPSSALPNGRITIQGTGLSKVTTVTLGGVAASITASTDSSLTVSVPAAPVSGAVSLTGAGYTTVAAQAFTALPEPIVDSVSSTYGAVSTQVTVSGQNLDEVASYSIGGAALTVVSATATTAILQLPAQPASGTIAFKDLANNVLSSKVSLAAYVPLAVTSMSPSAAAVGTQVTFTGQGLDAVTAVAFSNCSVQGDGQDAPAQILSKTATTLKSTVPPCAGTGPITVVSTYEPGGATYDAFSLVPLIWADWLARGYTPPTLSIDMYGGNLDQVTSATVGGAPAAISNQSPYMLTLTVPSNQQGPIVLSSASQPNVPSGGVSISSSGVTTLYGLNFAQVLDEQANSPHLRLTAGRPTLVRAIIGADTPGNPSPTVQITGTVNGTTLGSLTMTGPATLPVDNQTYNQSGTYNAVLPGTWVQPGLKVVVNVVPADGSPALTLQATPAVAGTAKINLVIVPLIIGGVTARSPSADAAIATLAFTYPYATQDINVSIRAPYAISGLTSIGTVSDLSNVLGQVEQLRQQEAPSTFYYGLVPSSVDNATTGGGKYVGLGHINDPSFPSTQWLTSAVGWDDRTQPITFPEDPFSITWENWEVTMIHELGHVHSRHHAPCGGAAGPDPSYPYAGGTMGIQPMYASQYTDTTPGSIAEPTTTPGGTVLYNSVMGYCPGAWFSDYDYSFVQAFAEAHSKAYVQNVSGAVAPSAAGAAASATPTEIWTYSGTITTTGVRMNPVHIGSGTPTPLDGVHGTHVLRLHLTSGGTIDVPLLPIELGDGEADHAKSFFVSVAAPGHVESVEVLHEGKGLVAKGLSGSALRTVNKDLHHPIPESAIIDKGRLLVTWDAGTEPYLTVVHVAQNQTRTVVANRLTGGAASIDVHQYAHGGHFEISTSSEIGGTLRTLSN